jgi:hypothetical protein
VVCVCVCVCCCCSLPAAHWLPVSICTFVLVKQVNWVLALIIQLQLCVRPCCYMCSHTSIYVSYVRCPRTDDTAPAKCVLIHTTIYVFSYYNVSGVLCADNRKNGKREKERERAQERERERARERERENSCHSSSYVCSHTTTCVLILLCTTTYVFSYYCMCPARCPQVP